MEKYIAVDNIDSYYEQVVKRKFSPATVTRLVVALGIIVTVFIVSVILMVTVADWLFFIVLTMLGLGIYLVYYLIKHSRVEYEYTFVLGELRIARIKGGAKRRNITYFDVKNIDDLGYYIDAETGKRTIDPSKYPNLLSAAEDEHGLDTYYFIIHDKVRKKPAVLLMTPNQKTFSLIRPYLSVELKKKVLKMEKEEERFRLLEEQAKLEAASTRKKTPVADAETEVAEKPEVPVDTTAEVTDKPEVPADTAAEVTDKPEVPADTTTEVTDKPEVPADTAAEVTDKPEVPADTTTEVTDKPEVPADKKPQPQNKPRNHSSQSKNGQSRNNNGSGKNNGKGASNGNRNNGQRKGNNGNGAKNNSNHNNQRKNNNHHRPSDRPAASPKADG